MKAEWANGERRNMTCAEFQRVLPYIIETGGKPEEEQHLRECPVCSDLVQDLRYIAEQAKLLVPMEDPSPRVWDGIKGSLEREGMIKPARARGRLLGPIPWIGALGAMILIAFGAFLVERGRQQQPAAHLDESPPAAMQTVSLNTVATEQDDNQLLEHVAEARPASHEAYENNLKQVNASIAEAKKSLEQDPDDGDARQSLNRAYEQKAMMYEMATRSLQ
jgi:hypothetical protein